MVIAIGDEREGADNSGAGVPITITGLNLDGGGVGVLGPQNVSLEDINVYGAPTALHMDGPSNVKVRGMNHTTTSMPAAEPKKSKYQFGYSFSKGDHLSKDDK